MESYNSHKMLKPAARDSKAYGLMKSLIESRNRDKLACYFQQYGEKVGVKQQFVLVLTAQQVANDLRGYNATPSLADEIIVQQDHKIDRYGDKAFPLSEKQIDVIVRDVIG